MFVSCVKLANFFLMQNIVLNRRNDYQIYIRIHNSFQQNIVVFFEVHYTVSIILHPFMTTKKQQQFMLSYGLTAMSLPLLLGYSHFRVHVTIQYEFALKLLFVV